MPRPPSDDQGLEREIDAALEGVNLQDPDRIEQRSGDARRFQRGVIVGVQGDDVFVELGPRMQGVAPRSDFETAPKQGDVFEFLLRGREEELWLVSRKRAEPLIGADLVTGALVEARITGQNTGGLEAKVGAHPAFIPSSQVGLHRESDLSQYLNRTLTCEVVEVDRERRRAVLSRRKVLERERDEARTEAVKGLAIGQTVRGKVTRVEDFGAFVDLGGGVEGLVHVSNLAHRRVEKAGEVLSVGQEVEARILKIEEGGKRIGLGTKQLEADPWYEAERRFPPQTICTGKVTRLMEFGAFVELAPGIEGLLHVSQLGKDRVRRPSDAVKPGEVVQVRVLAVERARSRISLTRLDARGALLGSEDSVDASEIDEALRQSSSGPLRTNLGSLFKKSLSDKPQPPSDGKRQ